MPGGELDIETEDWVVSFGMYYEGKLSRSYDVGVSGPDGMHYIESKSIMDLRKGGELTVTDTVWSYHESQPEEVMVLKEVARACRAQE